MGFGGRNGISYFADERRRNNDPNFFKKVTDEDLRRQVKRIIKDIRYNRIDEQDYIYFSNDRIISACLYTSYTEWLTSSVIFESLKNYLDTVLNGHCNVNMQQDAMNKRRVAANECNRMATRSLIWKECYNVFYSISIGGNIQQLIDYIMRLDQSMFREL